jgi:hypothetical protein
MVAHYGVSQQIDRKDRGKRSEAIFDPLAPVREISTREAIPSA